MVYLWLVSFLWAFSFGIIKGALSGLDSFFVALVRLYLAALVFAPLLWHALRRGHALGRPTRLAGIGALQFGVMYVAYFTSFRFLQAYEVALFTVFTPLYVTLFADALERVSPRCRRRSSRVAVAGSMNTSDSQDKPQADFGLGVALELVSNLAFAIGQVAYKRAMAGPQAPRDQDAIAWLYLGGAGLVGAAALVFTPWGTAAAQPQAGQWLALLYLGGVASGLGFFLWNKGARLVNTGVLAVFNNLKAPLAVAVSLLVFGEQASLPPLLLGGGILLLALWLASAQP